MQAKVCSYDGLPLKAEDDESNRRLPGTRWLKISTKNLMLRLEMLLCHQTRFVLFMEQLRVLELGVGQQFAISTSRLGMEGHRMCRRPARPCVMSSVQKLNTCKSILR